MPEGPSALQPTTESQKILLMLSLLIDMSRLVLELPRLVLELPKLSTFLEHFDLCFAVLDSDQGVHPVRKVRKSQESKFFRIGIDMELLGCKLFESISSCVKLAL